MPGLYGGASEESALGDKGFERAKFKSASEEMAEIADAKKKANKEAGIKDWREERKFKSAKDEISEAKKARAKTEGNWKEIKPWKIEQQKALAAFAEAKANLMTAWTAVRRSCPFLSGMVESVGDDGKLDISMNNYPNLMDVPKSQSGLIEGLPVLMIAIDGSTDRVLAFGVSPYMEGEVE